MNKVTSNDILSKLKKNLFKLFAMPCESNLERHGNCLSGPLLPAPLGGVKYSIQVNKF